MSKHINPEKELLFRLYVEENKTMNEVAKEIGIAVGKVYKLIHQYGIQINRKFRKPVSDEFRESVRQRFKGTHLSESAKEKLRKERAGKRYKPSKYGGHTKVHQRGYVLVYIPSHPNATKDGYVFEHILAYEKANDCIVDRSKYVVHHINEIKSDNRPENLRLMTKSEHMSYHAKIRHEKRRSLCKNLSLSAT